MSRTIRRKGQFERLIGTYEEFCQDYSYWMWRRPCLNIQQIFEKERAHFYRDQHSGHYGVPRWFRNWYMREERRQQRQQIHRCIRADEWGDFLVINPPDRSKWYFW